MSFVRIDPPLALLAAEPSRIEAFLEEAQAPSRFELTSALRELPPAGCRVLKFRGHDVSLICFRHPSGKIMHLFVTDARALPDLKPKGEPHFLDRNGWSTVAWVVGDQAYLLASAGGKEMLAPYVSDI